MKFTSYLYFSCFLFFISPGAKAQYCLINDKDGFVNVRQDPRADGKIICQLNNGVVVYQTWGSEEDSAHKNWVFVEFYISKEKTATIKSKPGEWMPEVMKGYLLFKGYVYKDRLIDIEKGIELKRKNSDNGLLLFNDSIRIKFTEAGFKKEKHKILKVENFVTKIDGHYFAGTDGGIPRYEIKSFSTEINNQKVNIPKTCYYDLYEPNLEGSTRAYVDKNGTIYIIMHNSDAAGSYDVIFIIKKGKYFTRYVFDGEC